MNNLKEFKEAVKSATRDTLFDADFNTKWGTMRKDCYVNPRQEPDWDAKVHDDMFDAGAYNPGDDWRNDHDCHNGPEDGCPCSEYLKEE